MLSRLEGCWYDYALNLRGSAPKVFGAEDFPR